MVWAQSTTGQSLSRPGIPSVRIMCPSDRANLRHADTSFLALPPTDPMPLSRSQTRWFVILFVALMLGLSIYATVSITSGWENETIQEQVREQETERMQQMPRLTPDDEPTPEPR